jgi:hypothetical protein
MLDDIQWWTGWNKTTTRRAIEHLPVEEIDLHGETGLAARDDDLDDLDGASVAPRGRPAPLPRPHPHGLEALQLPARHRPAPPVRRGASNIGPTLWPSSPDKIDSDFPDRFFGKLRNWRERCVGRRRHVQHRTEREHAARVIPDRSGFVVR